MADYNWRTETTEDIMAKLKAEPLPMDYKVNPWTLDPAVYNTMMTSRGAAGGWAPGANQLQVPSTYLDKYNRMGKPNVGAHQVNRERMPIGSTRFNVSQSDEGVPMLMQGFRSGGGQGITWGQSPVGIKDAKSMSAYSTSGDFGYDYINSQAELDMMQEQAYDEWRQAILPDIQQRMQDEQYQEQYGDPMDWSQIPIPSYDAPLGQQPNMQQPNIPNPFAGAQNPQSYLPLQVPQQTGAPMEIGNPFAYTYQKLMEDFPELGQRPT